MCKECPEPLIQDFSECPALSGGGVWGRHLVSDQELGKCNQGARQREKGLREVVAGEVPWEVEW